MLSDPRNNQIRLPGLGLRACSKVWETTSSMAVGFFARGGGDPSTQGQERTQISFAEISATFLLLEKRLPFGAQKKIRVHRSVSFVIDKKDEERKKEQNPVCIM